MPRKPRYFLPGVPVHIVQRGNNRQAIFFDDQDYHAYLQWLGEALVKYDCSLHAYVLMTNHVHLLITPPKKESLMKKSLLVFDRRGKREHHWVMIILKRK